VLYSTGAIAARRSAPIVLTFDDAKPIMTDPTTLTLAYHARTKHHLDRYAQGPGALDWDAQPNAFRHWRGCANTPLPRGLATANTPPASIQAIRLGLKKGSSVMP
jgi:hypothetical protein